MTSNALGEMLPQIILLSILAAFDCHTPVNNSEVFVTYNGHSEVGDNRNIFYTERSSPVANDDIVSIYNQATASAATAYAATDNGVLFVPNERPIVRNGDTGEKHAVGINDLLTRKHLSDVVDEKKIIVETEPPNADVVFISGRNKEQNVKEDREKDESSGAKKTHEKGIKKTTAVLNCTNFDCDTNQEPVCGGRTEQNKWKYRLFLNRCFFNRVNCDFRYPFNRYKEVDTQKCKDVAGRYLERPSIVQYRPYKDQTPKLVMNETRRSFLSRRSLSRGADGQFCTHACPASCTEDYDPQCAVSATGHKRVFLNHCKLDFNSCLYKIMWHRRPLSWCVGGKMADVRENRGFIAWMQRAGVVDRKGRLTLH